MASRSQNKRQQEYRVQAFNRTHKPGATVQLIQLEGPAIECQTETPAFLHGAVACVRIAGHQLPYALARIIG